MEAPAGSVFGRRRRRLYKKAVILAKIMASACMERGIAGLVIDGAVRDSSEIEELGFPFFPKALIRAEP